MVSGYGFRSECRVAPIASVGGLGLESSKAAPAAHRFGSHRAGDETGIWLSHRTCWRCGIAGIIGRLDDSNLAALERISDAMVHRVRTPAGHGSQRRTPAAGARCSHTAGSPSSTSHPTVTGPMVDPMTGHVVVFNGAIYNFGAFGGARLPRGRRPASPAIRPSCCAPSGCTGQARQTGCAGPSERPDGWTKRKSSLLPFDEFRAVLDAERGTATLGLRAHTSRRLTAPGSVPPGRAGPADQLKSLARHQAGPDEGDRQQPLDQGHRLGQRPHQPFQASAGAPSPRGRPPAPGPSSRKKSGRRWSTSSAP
jgi:hypothetical protein